MLKQILLIAVAFVASVSAFGVSSPLTRSKFHLGLRNWRFTRMTNIIRITWWSRIMQSLSALFRGFRTSHISYWQTRYMEMFSTRQNHVSCLRMTFSWIHIVSCCLSLHCSVVLGCHISYWQMRYMQMFSTRQNHVSCLRMTFSWIDMSKYTTNSRYISY